MTKNYWEKVGGSYTFYKGDKKLSLEEWNSIMNKEHSMKILEKHPNPLLRLEENLRRNKLASLIKKSNIIADVGCEQGYISKKLLKK